MRVLWRKNFWAKIAPTDPPTIANVIRVFSLIRLRWVRARNLSYANIPNVMKLKNTNKIINIFILK